jgi:alpha-tubulin suppressor-like RCC1 family protein
VGIKTDGTLWTWGLNYYGQLGDSSIVDKSSPVQTVSAGTNWQTAACGFLHTVAVKKDGTLWSWGYGIYGQIGQGANVSVSSPVQTLLGGTTWSKIDCGYYHTIAQKSDGTIWSWGSNNG